MKQGAEQTTFAYDARFRLASSSDAAGNATTYAYDDADRVIEKRLPGNRVYKYSYDADGNVATMTNPLGKIHRFGATGDDRPKSYTPPGANAYERAYSTERTLESTKFPGGVDGGHGLRRGRAADVGEPGPEQAHVRLRRRAGPLRHGHALARGRHVASRPSATSTTA